MDEVRELGRITNEENGSICGERLARSSCIVLIKIHSLFMTRSRLPFLVRSLCDGVSRLRAEY